MPFDIDDVSLDFQILKESVGTNQMQVLLVARGGGGKSMVAFGTFLAASAGLCLFFGEPLAGWYLHLLRG